MPADFFISYNKADRAWAEWIAWHLEAARYTTVYQGWDFRPGTNFVHKMQEASAQAPRTVAVLSPDYLTSGFAASEWAEAFAEDPTGERGLLLPVRVRECSPGGVLGQIVYVDLVALDEAAARDELLAGVKRGRAKPSRAPVFPGEPGTSTPKPEFPGGDAADPGLGSGPVGQQSGNAEPMPESERSEGARSSAAAPPTGEALDDATRRDGRAQVSPVGASPDDERTGREPSKKPGRRVTPPSPRVLAGVAGMVVAVVAIIGVLLARGDEAGTVTTPVVARVEGAGIDRRRGFFTPQGYLVVPAQGLPVGQTVTVSWTADGRGNSGQATVLQVGGCGHDAALLEIGGMTAPRPAIAVGDTSGLRPGDSVTRFVPNEPKPGTVVAVGQAREPGSDCGWLVTTQLNNSQTAFPGDAGAPVLDADGRVVAMIAMNDVEKRLTMSIPIEDIREGFPRAFAE